MIPRGKLTRKEDIEKFVAKKLGVEFIQFETSSTIIEWKNLAHGEDEIPFWREVSVQGWLEDGECGRIKQEKKLIEEGFDVVPCGPNNRSRRIIDYKKYLFDFEKELTVDIASLEKMD